MSQINVVLKIDLICIASNAMYANHAFTDSIQTEIPFLDILPCKQKKPKRTDPWLKMIINSINEPVAELVQNAQSVTVVFYVICLDFSLSFLTLASFSWF